MRSIFAFLIASTIFVACQTAPSDGYIINGLTKDVPDSTVLFLSLKNEPYDTAIIVDNKFEFRGKIQNDYEQMALHSKDYKLFCVIWLENKIMTFDASNSDFRYATVSGSSIQDQSNEFGQLIKTNRAKMDSINSMIRKSPSDSLKNALRPVFDSLREKENEIGRGFIKVHPDYELSAYFLTFYKNEIPKDSTVELFNGFTDSVKKTVWGESIKTYIEKSKIFEVGDTATDFTLSTLTGDELSLSDLKGKYVLLEFWAAWCGPCRRENPILIDAYSEFKDKGFEILGVNLDEKQDAWESAVKEDGVTWTTVSDLAGMNGEVPVTYSIYFIPNNFLLNKDGVVIAKNLRGDKLREELSRIFSEES